MNEYLSSVDIFISKYSINMFRGNCKNKIHREIINLRGDCRFLSLKDQPLNLFRWLEILNSPINTNYQFMFINLYWIITHSQYFLICSWAWIFGWIMLRVDLILISLLRILEIILLNLNKSGLRNSSFYSFLLIEYELFFF